LIRRPRKTKSATDAGLNRLSQLSQVTLPDSNSDTNTDIIDSQISNDRRKGKSSKAEIDNDRRQKLDANIRHVLYGQDVEGGGPRCLRKGINEIFANEEFETPRNGRCCSRCNVEILSNIIRVAVAPANERLTVRQSKDKKLHCMELLKKWRINAAVEVFGDTQRGKEDMEELGRAIINDETLTKWASKSSWLEDRSKIDGQHAVYGVIQDWPWADKETEGGKRWLMELYTILKETR
jgi:hypothetical protein